MIYPWQASLWQQFQRCLTKDQMPHAILLSGDPGMGKVTFAKACAEALLAVDSRTQQLFESEAGHPDLLHLLPEGKLQQLKVDQVRQVVDFLGKTALMGGYRVVIVEQAHTMNTAASNALLKTLEEPGAQTLLILTVDHIEGVLPTIRSRCQVWHVGASDEAMCAWLSDCNLGVHLERLLSIQGFGPLQLRTWAEAGQLDGIKDLLEGCLQKHSPIQMAATFKALDLVLVVNTLIHLVYQVMQCIQQGDPSSPYWNIAQKQASSEWFALLDQYLLAQRQLRSQVALNTQLFLEQLLIEWHLRVD